MLDGLDVSKYQGVINWAQVPPEYVFVWVKMTGSDAGNYIDPQASNNYYGAKHTGRWVGGYHVTGGTDPVAEANYFFKAMSPLAQYDGMALDIEPDIPAPAIGWDAFAEQFIQRLADLSNQIMTVRYLNQSQTNAMGNPGILSKCGLWLAAPDVSFTADAPVSVPYVFQQGPTTQVAGITANVVDTDVFFGTMEELQKYGYQVPAPQPAPVITPPVTPPTEAAPVQAAPVETAPVTDPTPVPAIPTSPVEPAQTTVNIPVKVTKTTGTNVDGILPAGTVVGPTTSTGDTYLKDVEKIYDNVGFIQKIVNLFKGRKTYIASALMLLTGIEKYFTGSHTLSQYITTTQGLFGSVGVLGITIRAAIAKLNVY